MNHIDYKYIRLLASYLSRFKDLGNDVFTFRCPICGDSKKKNTKTRGYLFGHDRPRFMCHNCGASANLPSFIKHLDPALYAQYRLEKFGNTKATTPTQDDGVFSTPKLEPHFLNRELLLGAYKLSCPQAVREVFDYVFVERKIPEKFAPSLYSSSNVRSLAHELEMYRERDLPKLPALVIPFFDKERSVDWIQCRILHPTFRYITLNVSGNEHAPKVWGVEWVDWAKPVYITEGPIDAMFLKNSLSVAGVANTRTISWIREKAGAEIIFCYDNDYKKNKEVRAQLMKRVNEGFGVVVYNKWFQWKDLNSAIMSGISFDTLNNYIEERTFFGIKAKLNIVSEKERTFDMVKTL